MNRKNNNIENRFAGICCADDGAPDSGGGGAGGEPAAPTDGISGTGGASPPEIDFDFRSHASDSPELGEHVAKILDHGDKRPDAPISLADIGALLKFDAPFKAAPQEEEEEEEEGGTTPPASASQPPAAQPPAAAQQPPDQIAALVEALKQVVPQQPAQQPAASQPKPPERKPFYGEGGAKPAVSVNPQLVGALIGSSDPQVIAQAQPAMDHLITSVMNQVVEDMTGVMFAMQRQMLAQIPTMVTTQTASQSNTQRFYDKFKELNKPAFHGVVNSIAAAMAKQKAKNGAPPMIDDKYLDDLGNAVHNYLQQELGVSFRPAGTTAPAPKPSASSVQTKPKKKAGTFYTQGNARPPAAANGQDQSADLRNFVL